MMDQFIRPTYIYNYRKRNSCFRAAKRSNDEETWNKYKCIRNKVVALLRRGKREYFYNLQFSTTKEFWKAVKVISKQDSNIPTLLDSDTPVTSCSGKADLLNQYFLDYFNHTFPPLNNPAPLDPSSCPVSLLCTEEDVSELLHNLNPAKSTGLDGVSAIMLKSTAPSITASLTKLWKPRRAISFDSATRNPHPAPCGMRDAGCGMRDAELRIPHPASRKVNFYIILCECPTITYGG